MENKTEIIALEGQQDLTIIREFDLPLELLFKAFEEPKLFEQWMNTKVLKLENKKHGSYTIETSQNGKVAFRANGTIHEFLPQHKIIRTFEMENMPIGVQLEFLDFIKLSEHTSKLTMHIIYRSEQHRAEQLKLPFSYGINIAHERLQTLMQSKNKLI